MSYICDKFTVPSNDGKNTLSGVMYLPRSGDVAAVIQISHGMVDCVGRYERLAEALTARGYALAGADHLGHGDTAAAPDDFGYFAKNGGAELLVDDLCCVNSYIKEKFPGTPVILFGHSMGSFIARLYAVKYPETISAIVIHGTAGKNPLLPFGRALVAVMKPIFGDRYRSGLIKSLADGGYNKGFDPAEGEGAWLTRDAATVADKPTNPKTSFTFTLSGYGDLFRMLTECNKRKWFVSYPKELPTLVMSGEGDPVGGFGKGVRYVYGGLADAGVRSLTLKLYPEARHELFNETNREEVFRDLSDWIGGVCAAK